MVGTKGNSAEVMPCWKWLSSFTYNHHCLHLKHKHTAGCQSSLSCSDYSWWVKPHRFITVQAMCPPNNISILRGENVISLSKFANTDIFDHYTRFCIFIPCRKWSCLGWSSGLCEAWILVYSVVLNSLKMQFCPFCTKLLFHQHSCISRGQF